MGNAKTAGLGKDIGLTGDQYNLCVTVYYVAMVVFGPITTVISTRVSGKYGLPGMLFGFGVVSICTSAVRNFSGLMACRFFLCVFESGYVASYVCLFRWLLLSAAMQLLTRCVSAVVYLSTFYTRQQLAKRIGVFYASSVLASAFGGLLAFGVFHDTCPVARGSVVLARDRSKVTMELIMLATLANFTAIIGTYIAILRDGERLDGV